MSELGVGTSALNELEEVIVACVRQGKTKFYLIDAACEQRGLATTARDTDKALQRLRKRGVITFEGGSWKLTLAYRQATKVTAGSNGSL